MIKKIEKDLKELLEKARAVTDSVYNHTHDSNKVGNTLMHLATVRVSLSEAIDHWKDETGRMPENIKTESTPTKNTPETPSDSGSVKETPLVPTKSTDKKS